MKFKRKRFDSVQNSVRSSASGFPAGSRIIVAVSGGADSVALLAALKKSGRFNLLALHCNFHLRGDESLRDELSVRSLCARLDVPLMVRDFDIPEYIRQHPGTSVEVACRELRYDWFRRVADGVGVLRIAVAHNADDNIETLMLNLMRGAGTSGLKGMSADNGTVWRPLLGVPRKDILEFLKDEGLDYVVDSTNLESEYGRNFMRNEVLPLLRSRWPGLDKAVSRTLHHLRDENRVVENAVRRALPADGNTLDVRAVLGFGSPELLIRRFIEPLGPRTTTAGEILGAIHAEKSDVRRWSLPGGTVELRGGRLILK